MMTQGPMDRSPGALRAVEAGLIGAIVSMICCWPVGVIAVVMAVLAMTNANNHSLRYARYAKTASAWGIGLGLAWMALVVGMFLMQVIHAI